ncbi:MAG: DUF4857 domain-containing protein, partial [Deferribacteraceae bacterium]|nr:DUF4857 domain-containing protein [Deferribacteraceae bacterium]
QNIGGREIPIEKAINFRDTIRLSPHMTDMTAARVQLFPLFESESGFTSLEFPQELFSIKERMEFINAAENRIDEEKSALFTQALLEADFAFPSKNTAGNTNPRKPYDFGYFALDSKDEIYHIYQAKSLPVVKNTGIKLSDNGAVFIIVRENPNIPYYGLLCYNGEVYQILKDGYKLLKLNLNSYNPYRQGFIFMLDPMHIIVKTSDEAGESINVATLEGELVKEHYTAYERSIYAAAVYDAVFPFILKNNPYKYGEYIYFSLSAKYRIAFIVCAVLAVFYAVFYKKRVGRFTAGFAMEELLIILGGVYAVSAIFLLDGLKTKKGC